MTIKIQAYQKYGKPCKEAQEFEFCCWEGSSAIMVERFCEIA